MAGMRQSHPTQRHFKVPQIQYLSPNSASTSPFTLRTVNTVTIAWNNLRLAPCGSVIEVGGNPVLYASEKMNWKLPWRYFKMKSDSAPLSAFAYLLTCIVSPFGI
jgi:hypothetical protein